jgi:hypothetical protein
MFDYTADNIVQSLSDDVYAAASNRDWDKTKLLRLLNRMIFSYLIPFIEQHRKDFFLKSTDLPLVANQAAYYLPSKAAGGKLRAIVVVDVNGNPYLTLRELALETAITFGSNTLFGPYPTGIPQGYYFVGNQIMLWPMPNGSPAGLALRCYYVNRPSSLVYQSSALKVTGFPLGTVPISCDLVQNVPGFDVLASALTPVNFQQGAFVEFTGTQPPQLAVGDWVCLTDTAPVITGGVADYTECLIQRAALQMVSAPPDAEAIKARRAILDLTERSARAILTMRRNDGDRAKVGAGSLYRTRGSARWNSGGGY